MKVIIAEKPSVAHEIAAIVGAKKRQGGFMEGNGYVVIWAFGHLVGLVMLEEYGFKGFKAENLPIMPKTFILKPRQIRDGKTYKNDPGAVKQLEISEACFPNPSVSSWRPTPVAGRAYFQVYLPLSGLQQAVRSSLDQFTDRQGHP